MSYVLNVSYKTMFELEFPIVIECIRGKSKELTLECDIFDFGEEIIIKLNYKKCKYSIIEIPILFCKRNVGKSKRDLLCLIKTYLVTIRRLM